MKVLISGRHVVVTAALRDYIEKKAVKIEEFFPGVKTVKVVLEIQKYRQSCEIVFKAARQTITARKTTKDMYASIDEAMHAVDRQANKRKEKLFLERSRPSRGRGGKLVKTPAPPVTVAESKKKEAAKGPKIVKVKSQAGPFTPAEAAAALEKSGEAALVFLNAETNETCVLVRRKKGFGLLEAKS